MNSPQLTIITITFNNFDHLRQTVESYLAVIAANDFECLVINGGSCRETQAYLEKNAAPKFRFITERDRGISDAFNKGARNARGTHVVFINSGDRLIDSAYLPEALAVLSSGQADFVFSDLIIEDAQIGPVVFRARPEHQGIMGRGIPFPHPTLIVKRHSFEKLGFFDDSFKIGMDYEWICRLIGDRQTSCYIERPTVLMDGTGVSAKKERQAIQENKRALKKNGQLTMLNRIALARRSLQYAAKAGLMALGLSRLVKAIRNHLNQGTGGENSGPP